MKKWYVAHTHPREETRALEHLQNQDFEAFLPQFWTTRTHARKIENVLVPLFLRYLFVKLDLEVNQWRAIDSTRGVSYLVRQGDKPAQVPSEIVEELQAQALEEGAVKLSSLCMFNPGDHVRVVDGAFAGQEGVYEKLSSSERVQLLLTVLGREVKVDLPLHAVTAT